MPTPWQRELAAIFTPMRAQLDARWEEVFRNEMTDPDHIRAFADWLLSGNPKSPAYFDEDFFLGDFDGDIACYSWILLGTGALINCRFGSAGNRLSIALGALAIAHGLACLDADAELYATLNRVLEQVANQKLATDPIDADPWSDVFVAVTTMRTMAATLQGRGKGNHIKLAALFKALRKAHHQPGDRRGTSKEIDEIEQALSRIKSPPRSKRALDTLYDAAYLIG